MGEEVIQSLEKLQFELQQLQACYLFTITSRKEQRGRFDRGYSAADKLEASRNMAEEVERLLGMLKSGELTRNAFPLFSPGEAASHDRKDVLVSDLTVLYDQLIEIRFALQAGKAIRKPLSPLMFFQVPLQQRRNKISFDP